MYVDLATKVRRNADTLTALVDDEVVMMSADQGQYFGLSPVGATIWNLTEKPVRVDDIIEKLHQEYDVSVERCKADTLTFLDNMVAAGLMEVVD